MALLGAALFEWHSGSSIGGFTSRGLGRFRLEDIQLVGVDMANSEQRVKFLTGKKAKDRLSNQDSWDAYFTRYIKQQLERIAETQED